MKKYMYGVLSVICALMMVLYYPLMAQQRASDTAATVGSIIPTGTVMAFAGATAPAGWVLAYGQEVSQTSATYKNLYAVISTTYCVAGHGAGGVCGGGNFRIPDYRGRVLGGKEDMGGSNPTPRRLQTYITGTTLGANSGSEADTPAGTVPGHYHTFGTNTSITGAASSSQSFATSVQNESSHTHGTPNHFHDTGYWNGNGTWEVCTNGNCTVDRYQLIGAYSWSGGGISGPDRLQPPGTVPRYTTTDTTGAGTSGAGSSHGHTANTAAVSITNSASTTGCIGGSATGACTGGTTGNNAMNLTGTAGNNLPPMAVVNYIIKL